MNLNDFGKKEMLAKMKKFKIFSWFDEVQIQPEVMKIKLYFIKGDRAVAVEVLRSCDVKNINQILKDGQKMLEILIKRNLITGEGKLSESVLTKKKIKKCEKSN